MKDEEKDTLAGEIVSALWEDLVDRRGIRQEFEGIDTATLIEMSVAHYRIVRRLLG